MVDKLEHIDETLIKGAKELLETPDIGLMAQALGSNPQKGDNLQMAASLKLKHSLLTLKEEIKKLRKSTDRSSWIMRIMTFFILLLTGVIVWKGL